MPSHPESCIQAQIVSTLSGLGIFLFSVPNEAAGRITPQKAARLKAMGLRSGISDLILIGQDGRAYFIEVKTETGRLSESQKRFQAYCATRGWIYGIVRSVEDAIAFCREHGLLLDKTSDL